VPLPPGVRKNLGRWGEARRGERAEKQVQKHQPQAEELLQVHQLVEKHLLLQHKSHK
jgi:hypothetical protein